MKYLVLILSLFLAWQVEASVLINEIMYDPIGTDANHEWIELVNTGTEPVDLTGWKLFEAQSNHGLTVTRGGFVIPSQGSLVIADNGTQFILDNSSYTGSVLDSTFSLNNTGETFEIRNNALETQDTLTYSSSVGASENGASLSRTGSGNWIEASATPGIANNETPYSGGSGGNQNTGTGNGGGNGQNSGNGNSSGNTSGSNSNTSSSSSKKEEIQKIKNFEPFYRGSLTKNVETVTLSTPVIFDFFVEKVSPKETIQVTSGITYISFGDGTSVMLPRIKPVVHEWQRPGTYTVVATYKTSNLILKPFVSVKQTITVIEPPIRLSVDDQNRIAIHNEGGESLDISNWYITQGLHDTQIPLETFLEKGADLILSDSFVTFEGGSLELLTSSGISVVDYIPESAFENNNLPSKTTLVAPSSTEIQNLQLDSRFHENDGQQQNKQPVDWLAVCYLLSLLILYSVVRVVFIGSPLLVSFAGSRASETETISEGIIIESFFV